MTKILTQVTGILGDFLKLVQDNNGNIGTYAVNLANGEISNVIVMLEDLSIK